MTVVIVPEPEELELEELELIAKRNEKRV